MGEKVLSYHRTKQKLEIEVFEMTSMANLGKDEQIITQIEVHWACFIPRILLALLFLLVGSTSGSFFGGLVLGVILLIPVAIRMFTTQLFLTNKRIFGQTGLINTKSMDAPLNKINTISTASGLFGKIFGYGNIHLTTSSGSYDYKGIRAPEVFRSAVMEEIDRFDEARVKKQATEMAAALK